MKQDVHPTYYHDCKVSCACGNSFLTGSTKKEIRVEICSACHPFFTGQQRFIDTEGRVDKFIRKRQEAESKKAEIKARMDLRKQKESSEKKPDHPKSLRDMLQDKQ